MTSFDPRLNAFRPDLADASLVGRVEAARFAPGEALVVAAPQAALRRAASERAPMETEALFGERVTVFETNAEGWAWSQLVDDRYVGYMRREALAEPGPKPTHWIAALRTFAFSRPDIKSPPLFALPLGARVAVLDEAEDRNARYGMIAPAGAVVMQHLSPLESRAPDFTRVAESFLGTPYLWGGKTSLGIDCSGLVQVALNASGLAAPRDSDLQEPEIGLVLPLDSGIPPLLRGDLVFWPGHVGIMRDGEMLLHANSHHMAVVSEPLDVARKRIRARGDEITSIRRLPAR
jgi:hypothetical protein